jgi:hypothetical protein
MFEFVDELLEVVREPDYVVLNTIELDVEAGRFPDVVAAYFAQPDWGYSNRFFIAEMSNMGPRETYAVGRLTFEAGPGQTAQVLGQDGGFRWGPNLSVGGVQVATHDVATAIRRCPFDPEDAATLQGITRFAWVAGRDLDELAAWVQPDNYQLQAKLSVLTL